MSEQILITVIICFFVAFYTVVFRRHKRLKNEQTANNRFWADLEQYEYEEEVLNALVAKEAELAKNPFTEPIPEIPETRPERSIKV